MTSEALRERYDAIKAEATFLAGGLLDIPRRVIVLDGLYHDSGGNHAFSLMASHGALWATGYFEAGGSLGRLVARRYFYDPEERAFRIGLLRQFAEGFRKVNRQVCIDTYTNYHFTKSHGEIPGAEALVPPSLLDALNRVHHARRAGRTFDEAERRRAFEQSFLCEQEVTVAPGVRDAVRGFECKVLRTLCMRPIVRFAYFPWMRYLWFGDFSDKQERIDKGLRAFDLAERVGWPRVERALRHYGAMDPAPLDDPLRATAELREGIRREAAQAAALFGEMPEA
jgi:hypothetical protein